MTAYLLYLNGILDDPDFVLDKNTLPALNERMPNHAGFCCSLSFLPAGPDNPPTEARPCIPLAECLPQ